MEASSSGPPTPTSEEMKQQARDLADQTTQRGKAIFEQQRTSAAGKMDSMAHAFRNTADQLQREGQNTGNYVGMIAEQLESAARQLREKNLDEILHDVQSLARRSPASFIAGSVAAGFLLTRFLKSSNQHAQNYASDARDDRRFASSYAHPGRIDDKTFADADEPHAYDTGGRRTADEFGDLSYRAAGGGKPNERGHYGATPDIPDRSGVGSRDTDASSSSPLKPNTDHLGGNSYGNR